MAAMFGIVRALVYFLADFKKENFKIQVEPGVRQNNGGNNKEKSKINVHKKKKLFLPALILRGSLILVQSTMNILLLIFGFICTSALLLEPPKKDTECVKGMSKQLCLKENFRKRNIKMQIEPVLRQDKGERYAGNIKTNSLKKKKMRRIKPPKPPRPTKPKPPRPTIPKPPESPETESDEVVLEIILYIHHHQPALIPIEGQHSMYYSSINLYQPSYLNLPPSYSIGESVLGMYERKQKEMEISLQDEDLPEGRLLREKRAPQLLWPPHSSSSDLSDLDDDLHDVLWPPHLSSSDHSDLNDDLDDQVTNRREFVNVPGLESFTEDADNRNTEFDIKSILAARQWELPYTWHKFKVPLRKNDTKNKLKCRCRNWKSSDWRSGVNFDTNISLEDSQRDDENGSRHKMVDNILLHYLIDMGIKWVLRAEYDIL
ncbi:hypothetical protein RR48_03516 [Papilio machaon]|uniref:Uncharacterized protein n=1 Tax=Papilio machaon TaxID=76193 RepID=A0A0N1I9G6_PAPMA|nr:hypothetical protein RR48_03516 [Papilio machaon]